MIRFDNADWQRIRTVYSDFWQHRLQRPVIPITVTGLSPVTSDRTLNPRGLLPPMLQDHSPEQLVAGWDRFLQGCAFIGDAFPHCWTNFGPGVLAALLGARTELSDTVWFHPDPPCAIDELTLPFDDQHPWLHDLLAIERAACDRWRGGVQVGMSDIGGVFDILSAFLPGEDLLLALYDEPDLVQGHAEHIESGWWRLFRILDDELRAGGNPGWSDWGGIWSPEPCYLFQSDFAYMVGPDMFADLIMPELSRSFAKVPHASYHLDGIGQLSHLDLLLENPDLQLIQWVPGAGQPGPHEWAHVFKRIREAGKLAQITCAGAAGGWKTRSARDEIEELLQQLGDARGLCVMNMQCDVSEMEEAMSWLERMGVPAHSQGANTL